MVINISECECACCHNNLAQIAEMKNQITGIMHQLDDLINIQLVQTAFMADRADLNKDLNFLDDVCNELNSLSLAEKKRASKVTSTNNDVDEIIESPKLELEPERRITRSMTKKNGDAGEYSQDIFPRGKIGTVLNKG